MTNDSTDDLGVNYSHIYSHELMLRSFRVLLVADAALIVVLVAAGSVMRAPDVMHENCTYKVLSSQPVRCNPGQPPYRDCGGCRIGGGSWRVVLTGQTPVPKLHAGQILRLRSLSAGNSTISGLVRAANNSNDGSTSICFVPSQTSAPAAKGEIFRGDVIEPGKRLVPSLFDSIHSNNAPSLAGR